MVTLRRELPRLELTWLPEYDVFLFDSARDFDGALTSAEKLVRLATDAVDTLVRREGHRRGALPPLLSSLLRLRDRAQEVRAAVRDAREEQRLPELRESIAEVERVARDAPSQEASELLGRIGFGVRP
jgi:hypothetical protein